MANAWAEGTHKVYQQKLSIIRAFENTHQFAFLGLPALQSPPITVDIPLMWIHESYSLRPSSKFSDSTVAFATIRHLRSAASQFLGWEMSVRTRDPPSTDMPIFCDSDGSRWTSAIFRTQFVYPCLYQLQAGGDAYLQPFTGEGNTVADKFWALHMYRRGARTHVGRGGNHNGVPFRKASKEQLYEHGRWRLKRSAQAIDQQYNEWPYAERIFITLRCR
jgi:hypothetical protein